VSLNNQDTITVFSHVRYVFGRYVSIFWQHLLPPSSGLRKRVKEFRDSIYKRPSTIHQFDIPGRSIQFSVAKWGLADNCYR